MKVAIARYVRNPDSYFFDLFDAAAAGVLQQAGHQVTVVERMPAPGFAEEELIQGLTDYLTGFGPELVFLSYLPSASFATRVREATGAVVATFGSRLLLEVPEVDYVISEPDPLACLELAEVVAGERNPSRVASLSWRDGDGRVVHEPEREKIADLDALPLPARQFLDNQAYRFPGITGPITTVKSSRGCPLDCSFCGYVLVQGRRFRFRSPASVLAELTDIVRVHDVHHVIFRDPIFTVRKDRVREICEGILERGLELEWQCETSVGTLDPPLLERMAAAGCKHVSLGLESGSAAIQKAHCSSKLLDLDRAEEVFRACRRLGIETRGFCMIGFPEETPEMVEETIRLAERMDPDQVQFCAVTAYPGTRLWQDLHGDHELDHADMTGHRGLEGNRHMSGEQIEARIREAYRRFYGRPKRMLRELRHPLRLAGRLARYVALLRRKG